MTINTPEDWWLIVENNWEYLCKICYAFLPEINRQLLEKTKKEKDELFLLRCFEDAWWNAPDSPKIHDIPGWNNLCDLCSEKWVFDKEY